MARPKGQSCAVGLRFLLLPLALTGCGKVGGDRIDDDKIHAAQQACRGQVLGSEG